MHTGIDDGSGTGGGMVIQGAGFAALHRAFPQMPFTGGKFLNPMTLVTIVASNDTERAALFQFSDDLIQSTWWPAVTAGFGLPRPMASLHLTGAAITADVTEAQLITYIQQTIAGGPQPNGNTLYLMYLPDGLEVKGSFFCAFHKPFPNKATTIGDDWSVVTRCGVFKGGETNLQALTRFASHEIIEAATDPILTGFTLGTTPPTPWTASIWRAYQEHGYVEMADICEGTRQFIANTRGGSWEYQRIWSNQAAALGGDPCVPAVKEPYFNINALQDWYSGAAGSQVVIPFTGWSTAPRGPWLLSMHLKNGSPFFLRFKTSFWTSTITTQMGLISLGAGCLPFPGINNGQTGTLTVNIPAGAQPGDFAVFTVHSFEEHPSNCSPNLDQDSFHFWLVGVYVP